MANAEVYCKWSSQGPGIRSAGGWAFVGDGQAAHAGGGGIIELDQHAERHAWAEAWGRANANNLRARVETTKQNFPNDHFEVKFWVDQQICPTCQKWLHVDVISHLKQLSAANDGLTVMLYAEVNFAGNTNNIRVQRSAIWPVTIGNQARYEDLPQVYN